VITIKKEINKFKQSQNGVTYSTKELIGALHTKVDNIREKMATKEYVNTLFGLLLMLIGALASYVFYA